MEIRNTISLMAAAAVFTKVFENNNKSQQIWK
jgi:hypothetical protein